MTRSTLSAIAPKADANRSQSSALLRASTATSGRRTSDRNLTPVYDGHLGPVSRRPTPAAPGGVPEAVGYTRDGFPVGRSLVLNATHQPLAVVTARRAVVLVLKEKAVILASNGVMFRSERLEVPAPSVIRLRYLVRVPYR